MEEARPPPPELDQTVDLLVDTNVSIDPALLFEQLLSDKDKATPDHYLFTLLPPKVRRRIYGYCFPKEDRKIDLSPYFVTKAVWPKNHFASPWKILEQVMGGLGAFRTLRYELMTYFWTEYHFHVTLSPFSSPKLSPLSYIWLTPYLGTIQRLTVEADLTRFGCSQLKSAPQFGYDLNRIEAKLVAIVKGILERQGMTTMAEFNIMCRRYAGLRPRSDSDSPNPDFYSPEGM